MKEPTPNTIKERLRKMAALCESQNPNERRAAYNRLKALMKSHNLTIDDIDNTRNETLETKEYRYKNAEEREILFAAAASIMQTTMVEYLDTKHARCRIWFKLSRLDHIELAERFAFYASAYRKQRKALVHAFIAENDLVPDSGKLPRRKIDAEHLRRVHNLMSGIAPEKYTSTRARLEYNAEDATAQAAHCAP